MAVLADGLEAQLVAIRASLREQALEDGIRVSRAFVEADRHSRGKLLAVDIGGNIIAANKEARALLDDLPKGFMLEPASRSLTGYPQLRSIVTQSVENLWDDPRWVGSSDIGTALFGSREMFSLIPVNSADGTVGWIISSGRGSNDGEEVTNTIAPPAPPGRLGRIAALHDGNVLFLSPAEIRYATADRHVVWLTTDIGRLRAATLGMDNVERELSPFGFLRVHRSYLVNVERIREVNLHGKGILTLSTDLNPKELIPVSRRSVSTVKSLLGL